MSNNKFEYALLDFRLGFTRYALFSALAWEEIKQRYRRSLLGPIWITISMGVTIAAMGPLYGRLLGAELNSYTRSLAIGLVLWSYISGSIAESCNAFVGSESFIRQIKLPLSIYLLKALARNLMVLVHNSVIIFLVFAVFPPSKSPLFLLALLGMLAVLINIFWIGCFLAVLCTRFRDVSQLVTNILQLLFFVTPVLWSADLLKDKRYIADWNIFFHFIECVRSPLIGLAPSELTWWILSISALVGTLSALAFFAKYRSRIAYWV